MQNFGNKSKMTAVIVSILMMTSIMLVAFPVEPVQAQVSDTQPTVAIPAGVTPSRILQTIAHISCRPRPIGMGQPLLVNVWIETEDLQAQLEFKGAHVVTITKPDETQEVKTLNSYPADSTAWFEIVVDQIGTWKFKFDFLGMYFPEGRYLAGTIVTNNSGTLLSASRYYSPSSAPSPIEVVVQENPVFSWPAVSIPTDYWTRPVGPQNREWWPILGNYPAVGVVGVSHEAGGTDWPADTNIYALDAYGYMPYVQGPTTPHIVWKQQFAIAGLIGGSMGTYSIWDGPTLIYGQPKIIYAGRGYQTLNKEVNGVLANVWQCYDIRTGEVFWELIKDSQLPTFIFYDHGVITVQGGEPQQGNNYLVYIGGGQLIKYSPWDGHVVSNNSISPLTTGTFYANPYALSVQNLGSTVPVEERYRLINWTLTGNSNDITTRVVSNITWPLSNLPGSVDFEAGVAVSANSARILSYSLTTGTLLANITTGIAFATSGTPSQTDHGKYAARYNDGHWHCWDLFSGKELWVSELSSEPWGTFGTYESTSYGGMIMSNQYDAVAAINWTNGKVVWAYEYVTVPYEEPYTGLNGETVAPWHGGGGWVADGIYYSFNSEHSPEQPIKRDWKMHAINVTTGESIWMLMAGQTGLGDGSRVRQSVLSDGYLLYSDAYTGTMYVIGKGKSATTVTAPDVSVPLGTSFTIKGTVLDMSPGQPGTPCVSKDSMETQMEYLHMQQPIGGIWNNLTITGVPVVLTAVGSDGSFYDIGTTTTDGYGGTFGLAWAPPAEGTYTITAAFAADDSYGSSLATTSVTVGPAPEHITIPEAPTPVDNTMLLYGILAAVIVAIVLALAALLWKR